MPTTWASARSLLNEGEFLSILIKYDKDNIPPRVIQNLKKYVINPQFDVAKIEKVSVAAKSLCQWVHAIVRYHEVYQNVAPKKVKLNKSAAELDVSKNKLDQKRKELFDIEQKLNQLRKTYDDKKAEGIKLKNKIKDTKLRLERAEKLINGLQNEQEQWTINKTEVIVSYDLKLTFQGGRRNDLCCWSKLAQCCYIVLFGVFHLFLQTAISKSMDRSLQCQESESAC